MNPEVTVLTDQVLPRDKVEPIIEKVNGELQSTGTHVITHKNDIFDK